MAAWPMKRIMEAYRDDSCRLAKKVFEAAAFPSKPEGFELEYVIKRLLDTVLVIISISTRETGLEV